MHISRGTIHEISVKIERNGIEFYKAMKEKVNDEFIDFMIEEEKKHIKVFTDIFGSGDREGAEPLLADYMDESMLASAYADTTVFSLVDPKTVTAEGLYSMAIMMEKSSILFYTELVEGMPERYQEEIGLLKSIRAEEKKHLMMLLEAKSKLTG